MQTNYRSNCRQNLVWIRSTELIWNLLYKKRCLSLETDRLRTERNRILQPQRTRIVGKAQEIERVQEYRTNQQGREQTERINILIYNGLLHYCATIVSMPLQEFQQNNNETWIISISDGECQVSHVKQVKCSTDVQRKFRRHESINLIRLKETAKLNQHDEANNERTTEAIKKAEKDFAMNLPLVVGDQGRENTEPISAIETDCLRGLFLSFPYAQRAP